jgi:nitrate/nitrite transport system substrate-binding protein
MKRWGYVKGDLDYAKVAAQAFAADQCREVMKTLGYKAPDKNSVTHAFLLGKQKTFDPAKPAEYLSGFVIKRA